MRPVVLHVLSSLAALILLFSVLIIPICTNILCHSAALTLSSSYTVHTHWHLIELLCFYSLGSILAMRLCSLRYIVYLMQDYSHLASMPTSLPCFLRYYTDLGSKLASMLCRLVCYDLHQLICYNSLHTSETLTLYSL